MYTMLYSAMLGGLPLEMSREGGLTMFHWPPSGHSQDGYQALCCSGSLCLSLSLSLGPRKT